MTSLTGANFPKKPNKMILNKNPDVITTQHISDILIKKKLVSIEAIGRINAASEASQTSFSFVATRLGLVSEYDMAMAFSELMQIEVARINQFPEQVISFDEFNYDYLKLKRVLPLSMNQSAIHLAMADPTDNTTANAIAFAVNRSVTRFAALESELDEFYFKSESVNSNKENITLLTSVDAVSFSSDDVTKLSDHTSDAPVIRLVNRVILEANDLGASDIHFEPETNAFNIRYRIDGLLQQGEHLPSHWADPVASRIKLMAKLDIAEKRVPQDGRIQFSARGQNIDLRIATFPSIKGESIVVRLLGQQRVQLDLDTLELSNHGLAALRRALKRPHGIILMTGPTGSGKTTTLYASLNALLNPELKIVTVEDPVEYVLDGVSQLQVKPEIDLTYANALRSILRNDPDIIMVGEIRDRETADIAIRAALTGHLVLSTLHTNTAAGAITRLLDLGVEAFLLASTLELTAAQRLVRKLCPQCKLPVTPSLTDVELFRGVCSECVIPKHIYVPNGCSFCKGRGFWGRTSLFEAIEIDENARQIVREWNDEAYLVKQSQLRGGTSLWQHGVEKVLAGITSLDEILRVVK